MCAGKSKPACPRQEREKFNNVNTLECLHTCCFLVGHLKWKEWHGRMQSLRHFVGLIPNHAYCFMLIYQCIYEYVEIRR